MTVVITGANRGIGHAMLVHYQARGVDVIGTHRQQSSGQLMQLDVTDRGSHTALVTNLGDRSIDLLVCNAGVYLDKGENWDTGYPPEMWANSFAANVTGVFLTIQHLLASLRRADNAKIAIISSQMASDTHAPGGSYIYRASKAAVLNLGRNLATDLRHEGIAVGIYHPGWVRTDMGGSGGEITAQESAAGLINRFEALSLDNTGCFETWDGRDHPY